MLTPIRFRGIHYANCDNKDKRNIFILPRRVYSIQYSPIIQFEPSPHALLLFTQHAAPLGVGTVGGNHFPRDCTKPAKKDGDEKNSIAFHRDHVRKYKFFDVNNSFMAEASRTVFGISNLINVYAGEDMFVEGTDRTCDGLQTPMHLEVATMASREVSRRLRLGFMGKVKCCLDSNTQYFEILDEADF